MATTSKKFEGERRAFYRRRSNMGTSRRRIMMTSLKLVDLLVLSAVFFLAAVPVWRGGDEITFAQFLSMRIKVENFVLFFALLGIWHVIFTSLGVYRSQRLESREEELTSIFWATSSATTLCRIGFVLFRIRMVTPTYVLAFGFMTTCIITAIRLGLRFFLEASVAAGEISVTCCCGNQSRAVELRQKNRIQTRNRISDYWICGRKLEGSRASLKRGRTAWFAA